MGVARKLSGYSDGEADLLKRRWEKNSKRNECTKTKIYRWLFKKEYKSK